MPTLLLAGCSSAQDAPAVPTQETPQKAATTTALQIGSAFTSADGTTITVVLKEAAKGLTPAKNISGFSITALPFTSTTPFDVAITSSHVEGDTIKFTLAQPITAGKIVRLNAANSNLTDGNGAKLAAISNLRVDGRSTVLAPATGKTEVNSDLVRIPTGSLDKWRAGRDGAKNQRVELVLFGDSTAFGSSGSPVVPWIYRVRGLSAEAGYNDGGRGNVSWADSMLKASPNEPADTAKDTVVSKTGFSGSSINGVASMTYFDSKVAGDSITLQGYGEQIRLHYQRSWISGVFTYSVDGGPEIEVNAFYPRGVQPDALLITGLTRGRHTITIKNNRSPAIASPSALEIKLKDEKSPKAPAQGTYYYGLTAFSENGESTMGEPNKTGPVELSGAQIPEISTIFQRGWKGIKLYRSASKNGPFGLVKTFTYSTDEARRLGISDEEGTAPGAQPPTTDTLGVLNGANSMNVGVDWLYNTGIVYHRNADSGATFGSYDFDDDPIQVHGKPGHLALGLVPQDGPYVVDTRPTHRAPVIALSALGINNQQGGQLDTNHAALGTKNFIERARAAGAEPVVIIPHYLHSNSPATSAPFVAAQKNIANAYGVPWFDFDVALDNANYRKRDGKTPGDPHLDQKGYDIEADSIWENLLNSKSSLPKP